MTADSRFEAMKNKKGFEEIFMILDEKNECKGKDKNVNVLS